MDATIAVLLHDLTDQHLKYKIWYSICRTMSDHDVLCGNVNDRSVRAIAVKPRAFGAPLCGVGA